MHPAVALTIDLIARPSVTPDPAGCHHALREVLSAFNHQDLPCNDVANLLSTHGQGSPFILFAGHCDVVPPGPLEAWNSAPFDPTISDGILYGRGAADMKSGLAAMTVALAQFVRDHPHHQGTVGILSTSDEEGAGVDGTRYVLQHLNDANRLPDYALVGEPTSEFTFGDTIKVGRRGSITGYMKVQGIQGHVAYPHLADNPIHRIAPFLAGLSTLTFDQGNAFFPPTSLQIANIHAGTGAVNVIPGEVVLDFNIRNSPETTPEQIKKAVGDLASRHQLEFQIDWVVSADAFLTDCPELVTALTKSIQNLTSLLPTQGTGGGTSDARYFAKFGIPVIEFGPINQSIHAANEHVKVDDIAILSQIYSDVVAELLS